MTKERGQGRLIRSFRPGSLQQECFNKGTEIEPSSITKEYYKNVKHEARFHIPGIQSLSSSFKNPRHSDILLWFHLKMLLLTNSECSWQAGMR